MKLCSKCQKTPVFESKETLLCKGHFNEYIFGKASKVLRKYANKKSKILLALSGGKDSVCCFYILSRLGYDFTPVYLDFNFNKKNLRFIKKLSDKFKKEIIVLKSLDYGLDIKKLIDKKFGSNPCVICSTARRYILNDYGVKNKFELISTGHNLTDAINQALNNIKNNFFLGFKNITPFLKPQKEKKLLGRIKPLYLATDNEIKFFMEINDIPYFKGKCPYFKGFFFKKYINNMEKENKDILIKMAYSLANFSSVIEKTKDNIFVSDKLCKLCGYPSSGDICSFCKITKY